MEELEIEDTVRKCLKRVVGENAIQIDRDIPLREAIKSFDSLAAMEFITALEDAFRIVVDFVLHDVRFRMETIEKSVDFVRELLEDKKVLGV